MEPTKLPRWGVPVVVMPVRKRVVLMGTKSAGGRKKQAQRINAVMGMSSRLMMP